MEDLKQAVFESQLPSLGLEGVVLSDAIWASFVSPAELGTTDIGGLSDTSPSLFIFQLMDFITGDNLRIEMDKVSIGVHVLVHTLIYVFD
jgi:hypothetical protein